MQSIALDVRAVVLAGSSAGTDRQGVLQLGFLDRQLILKGLQRLCLIA